MIQELQTRYGTMFVPDTDTSQYDWFSRFGVSCEDEWIDLVIQLLAKKPKGTVIDVGANFGCWTLALAPYAKRVLAFEPQRSVKSLLHRSIDKNRFSNITVIGAAVGAVHDFAEIPDIDPERGAANFGGIEINAIHPQVPDAPLRRVHQWTLDEFVCDNVTFIKIDVEGSEEAVLQGALRTIAKHRPIMFIEALFIDKDYRFMEDPPKDEHGEVIFGPKQEEGRVKMMARARALEVFIESLGYGVDHRGPNYLCMPL